MSRPPGSVPHRSLASLAAVLMLCATGIATADTITVITSFPKELTSAYQKAFEAKYSGDKLEILNKS